MRLESYENAIDSVDTLNDDDLKMLEEIYKIHPQIMKSGMFIDILFEVADKKDRRGRAVAALMKLVSRGLITEHSMELQSFESFVHEDMDWLDSWQGKGFIISFS